MRKEFSRTTKALAFQRANGKCEGENCGARLTIGKYEYDHANPDGLTGDNSLGNCVVLCLACHRGKTRTDVANIARAKRVQARHIGAHVSRNPIRGWRKFDGTIVFAKDRRL